VQIVDKSGAIVNSYAYDEWGNITSQTEGIQNSFKYTGEIYDEETGLYYLRARYYDPSIGRFINEDTYEGQIDNPLSLNLYTYVHNNPLIYTDPTGHMITMGSDSIGGADMGVNKKPGFWSSSWNSAKNKIGNIKWGEVGLGMLQAVGGGFSIFGGFTLATGGTAASGGILGGITITAGGILMVDGTSNAIGGLSRAWNGIRGSSEGDTFNFVKRDIFMKASPENGEEYYNYYQLGLGVLSLGLSANSLAATSGNIIKSANGSYQLTKDGISIGFNVVEGSISKMTITYYTSNGSVYKTVQVNTGLMLTGTTDITQTITNMYFTKEGMQP
ncbi:RHS repeat-associated protein, partial [Paenibacillus sp. PastF-1]